MAGEESDEQKRRPVRSLPPSKLLTGPASPRRSVCALGWPCHFVADQLQRETGNVRPFKLVGSDDARHIAVTPDGPRGPRRKLQERVVFLASRTGLPLVLVGVGYEKVWRAGSWDRFAALAAFAGDLVEVQVAAI